MVTFKTILLSGIIASTAAADTTTFRTICTTSTRLTTTTPTSATTRPPSITSCRLHADYWACDTTFTFNLCGTPTPSARYPPVVPTNVANRCSSLGIKLPSGWSTAYPEDSPAPTTTEAVTATTSIPPVITDPPPPESQALWKQCGGIGWGGPTVCAVPAECKTLNPYYAQCL
ncbi:hypothetical protein TWF281_001626 [Arthrobotrys megalospora]